MATLNLTAAWAGILLGMVAGALLGLGFHREEWFGGYGSWRRRLLRLGHVSLFGIAFLNLAFACTADRMGWTAASPAGAASLLLCAGAVLMPAVCGLAAWRKPLRRLFLLPVACLLGAALVSLCMLGCPAPPGGGP